MRWFIAIGLLGVIALILYRLGIHPLLRLHPKEAVARGRAGIGPAFTAAAVAYPPDSVVLTYFKDEQTLSIWAGKGPPRKVKTYPVLAASGEAGPKLREGDRQVPEGIYAIELLNPKSRYHLSLRINYPNAFDRAQAARESRADLGGDIMIHGAAVSIGCIAIGDAAIEEVYALASDANFRNWKVILSPTDFRKTDWKAYPTPFEWARGLYESLDRELRHLPLP